MKVRGHFRKWAAAAPHIKQDSTNVGPGQSPRYRYCVQVNDEALDSVVRKAPPPEDEKLVERGGFVNKGEFGPIEGCTFELPTEYWRPPWMPSLF